MLYSTSNLPTTGISQKEKQLLREWAWRVRELANSPANQAKKAANYQTNDRHATRPLIMAHPQEAWSEIITPAQLRCEHPLARIWEEDFLKSVYQYERIKDDTVLNADFILPWIMVPVDFGVPNVRTAKVEKGGSYAWHEFPIRDLDRDLAKLKFRRPAVDRPNTLRIVSLARELFGDVLEVRAADLNFRSVGLTVTAIELIGLENLLWYMYDQPAGLHRLMAWLRDEQMNYLEWLEREQLLGDNCDCPMTGTGGSGYTRDLPAPDRPRGAPVRWKDVWGLADSQETTGVSPGMFNEFVLPYQMPLLEKFGLNYYGCCEPLDTRIDSILQVPRLRAVSVSPWTNQAVLAERLGRQYVYCRKPHPALVSGPAFNEEEIRKDLRQTLKIAGHLNLVFILKDTHTVHQEPQRISRWVEMAREEVARYLGAGSLEKSH